MKTLNESQCIWMECGYIGYKLCDRNFDCDNCEFDKAIHAQNSGEFLNNKKLKSNLICSDTLNHPNSINYFSSNHLWFSKIDNEEYYCGIDDVAIPLIAKARTLMFPETNVLIQTGSPLFWIVTEIGVVSVTSPADIIIKSVYQNSSNALQRDNAKWFAPLIALTITQFCVNAIFENGNPPFNEHIETEKRKMRELASEENPVSAIGATYYDGGIINLASMTKGQFHSLLRKIFTINFQE